MHHVLCRAAFRPICMLLLYAITQNPGRLFFGRHKSSHCKPGLRLRTSSEIFMLFVILADNTIFTIK